MIIVEKIKKFIRDYITYDVEVAIRALLCSGFRKIHRTCVEKTCRQVLKIERSVEMGNKISVVFFCHFPAVWNAVKPVFQAALDEADMEVYLLALPVKVMKKNLDYSHEIYEENRTYEYCRSFYPDTINAVCEPDGSWFDLTKLKPNYIVLSRPYDKEVPPCYQSDVLSTYAKICYIPYSYCKMNWDSRLVYGLDFMDYVYAVFTESPQYCRLVRKIFYNVFKAGWKKINYLGYPRFDLYYPGNKKKAMYEKTVLWLPRWSTKEAIEPSTFFQYKDLLIDYFKGHPQYQLICRPHQLMFRNFILSGEMSEKETERFKTVFYNTENFLLDESGDYMAGLIDADIFISDTSSLLIEEFITGKPILFCGNMKHFDREAKRWAKRMYSVRNGEELIYRLGMLLDDIDPDRCLREQFIRENMKLDGKCGKRIIEFIKEDYKKSLQKKETENRWVRSNEF